MTENKKLIIKGINLISLNQWLFKLPLVAAKSRRRQKLLQVFNPYLEELEKTRKEIAIKYADKDEAGKPQIINGENGENFDISDDNMKAFNQELEAVLNQPVHVAIENPDQRELMIFAKDTVLNTTQEFAGALAQEYDAWFDVFENY